MIVEYLKGRINFKTSASTWKDAIITAASPLLADNSITSTYIDEMINSVEKNGSYIVIIPEVAIPHARKEFGALKTGLSFLRLETPVIFPDDKAVKLVIVLCSDTDDGHLAMLSELSMILINEEVVAQLKEAKTENEVLQLLSNTDEL